MNIIFTTRSVFSGGVGGGAGVTDAYAMCTCYSLEPTVEDGGLFVGDKPPVGPKPQCWMSGREGYQVNTIETTPAGERAGSVDYDSQANIGVPCCPHFWVTCGPSM
jgi:hypothetical protein